MSRQKRILVIMVGVGIMLIVMAITDLIATSKEALSLDDLKISQLQKGEIVEGEVLVTLGCFQEGYRTRYGIKSGSSDYYYALLVEDKVIALKCAGKTHEALDKQKNFFLNYDVGDDFNLESVPIKGKVKIMDSETEDHLEEFLYDEESGKRYAETAPYIIDTGILSTGQAIILIAIGVVLIAIPLLITILAWRSANRPSESFTNENP